MQKGLALTAQLFWKLFKFYLKILLPNTHVMNYVKRKFLEKNRTLCEVDGDFCLISSEGGALKNKGPG